MLDLDPDKQHDACQGRFLTIGHTESRVEELSNALGAILKAGVMSIKDAERLRGRLQWFESFAHGRVAQQALKTVSGLASQGRMQQSLNFKEEKALKFLRERVLTAPPMQIQATNLNTWLIFTDGACEGVENKIGVIGAVLVSPSGRPVEYFSEKLPDSLMDLFLQDSNHPIFELELLPVLAAVLLWAKYVQNSQCVFYLDNEAAKGALIHGATSTEKGMRIIEKFVLEEMRCQIKVWFARVPTSSNIADKPSRLETGELDSLGVHRRLVDWPLINAILEEMDR